MRLDDLPHDQLVRAAACEFASRIIPDYGQWPSGTYLANAKRIEAYIRAGEITCDQ